MIVFDAVRGDREDDRLEAADPRPMRNVELEEPAEEEFAQYVETDMMHWKVGILLGKQTRSEWWNTLDQQIPEWNDDRVPTIEDLKIVLQHFGLRFPNIRASSIQWGGSQ